MKSQLYTLITTLIIAACLAGNLHAKASATVSRDTLSMDETVTLVISSDDPDNVSAINMQPIEVDFDVLSSSESSQFRMINGKTTASKQWQISLAPKREGDLTIPSLEVGNDHTDSIRVRVSGSTPMDQRAGVDNIFMEAELNQTNAWVQQELIYTTRIYYYPGLQRGAELSPLDLPNAITTQLSETNYEKKIGNKSYVVYEVKYAIFPQSSGNLTIPGQVFQGSLADPRQPRSFFGFNRSDGSNAVRLKNEQLAISIQPRPSDFSGKHWLPARSVKLREEWSENPNGIRVGQPVTRSIIIEADGLQASQLPPLKLSALIGAQTYPDDAESKETPKDDGVSSTRIEKMAIIPSTAGNLTLPAIELNWWNTTTEQMETASLPVRTLSILPGSSGQAVAPSNTIASNPESNDFLGISDNHNAPSPANNSYWKYAFFGIFALWLFTLASLLTRKNRTDTEVVRDINEKDSTEEQLYNNVLGAKEQPIALRTALLAWAKKRWQQHPINSLTDIINKTNNPVLETQLKALDTKLFNKQSEQSFNSEELLKTLNTEREEFLSVMKPDNPLPPLYRSDT